MTLDELRDIALELPGAYEQPSHGGRPSWRTPPRMFAWVPEDPEALVVWVESLELKEALLDAEPELLFDTPHHRGHPVVLARLDRLEADTARELLTESWRLRAPRSLVRDHRT